MPQSEATENRKRYRAEGPRVYDDVGQFCLLDFAEVDYVKGDLEVLAHVVVCALNSAYVRGAVAGMEMIAEVQKMAQGLF